MLNKSKGQNQILRELGKSSMKSCIERSKQRLPSLFRTDSQNLSDPHKIADHFCRYFSNIGSNLASKIQVSDKSHRSFLPERLLNSIFFLRK